MLRGRHRGLPVAIDRAVVLPFEFRRPAEDDDDDVNPEHTLSRRRGSVNDGAYVPNGRVFNETGQSEKLQRHSWRSSSADSGSPQLRERTSTTHDHDGLVS